MSLTINEVDRVEILTLQDNYVDLAVGDTTGMLERARPLKGLEVRSSILAEHGFSALVTVRVGGQSRSILFDFGFSAHGAAFNAAALEADLTAVETLALSHGHPDHVGGLDQLVERIGRKGIELVLHPAAFRGSRYLKVQQGLKIHFPQFTREKAQAAGTTVIETIEPYPLLGGSLLFLGEIPRKTEFEKGMPRAHYEEDGQEKWDSIEEDTAVAANVKGKGLVVLSGCAHSGIINTLRYAQVLTGVDKVLAVMGGFHLTGPDFADIIEPTTEALKDIDPDYVLPTHCTGRNAVMYIEKEMPDKFLLNMAGTKLTFSA